MPVTVNMTLNEILMNYPVPDESKTSNGLQSWDKELLFNGKSSTNSVMP